MDKIYISYPQLCDYINFQPNIPQSLPPGYTQGSLTFDSEGNNDPTSLFFSRLPHWPGGASGVTIGRGYDMKLRTQDDVFNDLYTAGIEENYAAALSLGAGLIGIEAKNFANEIKQTFPPISEEVEINLFNQIYPEYIARAKFLANKSDVTQKYGYTDWDKLHPGIKEVLIDLTYQGQYTPRAREEIQEAVVANDINLFFDKMYNGSWPYSKDNRFRARVNFLEYFL